LGLLTTPLALVVSLAFLGVMLYKRVNLGITLNVTALLLAFLALDILHIPELILETTIDPLTISITLATFGIMLLSQLYKETLLIERLSSSLSRIINNPKIVLCILPAVMGFLPVAGGALMSAPLVDTEAKKLSMPHDKKAYVNLWFRHTIFPIYPLSQVLILTAALAVTSIDSIIIRQIPVVIVMGIAGYVIGFRNTSKTIAYASSEQTKNETRRDFKDFAVAFSPIVITIIVAIGLGTTIAGFSQTGLDVLLATVVGIAAIILISKMRFSLFTKPLKTWSIYGITLAAYGAFLLGSVMRATGISHYFEAMAASGNVDVTLLLAIVPAVLGILTASALGGVSLSVPILGGIIALTSRTASLIYMSAYLGYVVSPTHLCFAFTADYFKCPMQKIYKYALPSFAVTFATALLMYYLIP
jgi:integral membrane protein (TIGR00529 family)